MNKKLQLRRFLICISILFALIDQQAFSLSARVGVGMSWDFSVDFMGNRDYVLSKEESSNVSSMLSLDLSAKIPIKNIINICPAFMISVVDATFTAENKKGRFMPEGLTVTQPYSTLGTGWALNYYGEDYLYYLSDASISQTSGGAFLTKNVSKSIEIGSGFFLKTKSEKIKSYKAYDKYVWAFDTQLYDYYDYSETSVYESPSMVETLNASSFSIPLIIQWSGVVSGHTYMGASVVGYVSKDTYYSVRMTLGHEF